MQRIKSALHEVKLVYCYPRELNFYTERELYTSVLTVCMCVSTELWVVSMITYIYEMQLCLCMRAAAYTNI